MKESKKQIKGGLMSRVEVRALTIWAALCRLIFPLHVSAKNKLEETKLYKGITNLIGDAITAATVLTAGVVAFFFIKNMYKHITGEEDEKPAAKKNAKNTIVIGVLIIMAEVIVNVLFSYFTEG